MKNIIISLIILILANSCVSPEKKPETTGADEGRVKGAFEIACVGDIMPGRRMAKVIEEKGIDYVFDSVRPILKQCPVVFGNLETPLVHEDIGTLTKNGRKQVYLYAEEIAADGLKSAGFNVLSLANNHVLDYGQKGIIQTMEILEKRGIKWQGIRKGALFIANEPAIIEVEGTKVGFLCYSEVSHWKHSPTVSRWGTNPCIFKEIKRDIKNARPKCDILIVYLHWGKENRKVQKFQYVNAKKVMNFGADAVIGSHTHLFQDVELYDNRFVFYGMGNFVFDMEKERTKNSGIVKFRVENKKITGASIVPVYLEDYRPVVISDYTKKAEFISGLQLINLEPEDLM
ncbi:MAG TPA: CapA family protein [Candidatus Goldiibacteriota bacterium]|nr:CapA family protein [Candidatus Goldiibacteriota bacterium]